MRLHYIVAFATVTLCTIAIIASVDAISTLDSSVEAHSLLDRQSNGASKRLLRTDVQQQKTSDEERGVSIYGDENLVKSGVKKTKMQLWLAHKKSADDMFKLLKLEDKAKTNFLFGSMEFLTWTKYVTKLKKKDAGAAMVKTLLKHYDDGALARLIAGTKSSMSPTLQALGKTLQEAQFTKWMIHEKRPIAVKTMLKSLPRDGLWAKKDKEVLASYKYFIGVT